jgi:hypothetical protein
MPLTSNLRLPIPWASHRHAILLQLKKMSRVVKVGIGGCAPCPAMNAALFGNVGEPSWSNVSPHSRRLPVSVTYRYPRRGKELSQEVNGITGICEGVREQGGCCGIEVWALGSS